MNLHQQQLSALNCCSYKELGQQIFLLFGNVLCCIAIYFSYPLQVYIISVAFYFVYWERGQLMRLFLQGESVWSISLKHSKFYYGIKIFCQVVLSLQTVLAPFLRQFPFTYWFFMNPHNINFFHP